MKRRLKPILGALGLWLALLLLLLAAEGRSGEATIRSFGDALWFSFITMTTVGYGDLAPVTPLGRVLGAVFALCSLGVLAAMVTLGLRLVGGELLPRLRLRAGRGKSCFVFDGDGPDAAVLAAALRREDPSCLLVFPAGEGARVGGEKALRADIRPAELRKLRGGAEGLCCFFLSGDEAENCAAALAAAKAGLACCCLSALRPEGAPPTLRFFDRRETLARGYWQAHPLDADEERILLIGCGPTGAALLEQALLVNVFERGRRVEYHVFEDSVGFPALHGELARALSAGGGDGDLLVFHAEPLTEARELIRRADRIILCHERDEDVLSAYETLKALFVCGAEPQLRLSRRVEGLCCFGSREELLRPALVMKAELERRARLMNEIYNASSPQPRAWEELSPFLRLSNLAAADHVAVKARILLGPGAPAQPGAEDLARAAAVWDALPPARRASLRETEHRRWLRFYRLHNWTYAPQRDDALRRHPLLLPFGELTEEEQAKDDYAWEMLKRLSAR